MSQESIDPLCSRFWPEEEEEEAEDEEEEEGWNGIKQTNYGKLHLHAVKQSSNPVQGDVSTAYQRPGYAHQRGNFPKKKSKK